MKIKFSRSYEKLLDCTGKPVRSAVLLGVFRVNLEDLSEEFLDYDTDNGLYPLPKKGRYLMLVFRKPDSADLFTTLRRWIERKEEYYRGGVGKKFEVGVRELTQHEKTIAGIA